MSRLIHCISGLALVIACAQEPVVPPPAPPPVGSGKPVAQVKPSVERLDEARFKVGAVVFDQKTREVRFPAVVNAPTHPLEYVIVRPGFKDHETLLIAEATATEIHLALTLLRYPPSRELYPLPNDRGGLSGNYPEVAEAVKTAARIQIKVEWKDGGKTRTVSLNEWIQHAVKGSSMPETLWVYGGSVVDENGFAAERSGEIVGIFPSESTLINYPDKDSTDDTVWVVYPRRVPPEGTKVTVILAPNPALKPASKGGAPAASKPGAPEGGSRKPARK